MSARTLLSAVVATLAMAASEASLSGQELPALEADAGLEILGHADYGWEIARVGGPEEALDAFRGRVVFLNFWATWCKPCVQEMASIARLAEVLEDTDVAFVLVSPEREAAIQRFARLHGLDLPLYREVQDVPSDFGVIGLPTTVVLDTQGQIVLRHFGAAAWDQSGVEDFLRALDGG